MFDYFFGLEFNKDILWYIYFIWYFKSYFVGIGVVIGGGIVFIIFMLGCFYKGKFYVDG